jgi:hypothetical protein
MPYFDAKRPDDVEHSTDASRVLLASIDLVGSAEVCDQAVRMFTTALAGELIVSGPEPKGGQAELRSRSDAHEKLFQDAYADLLQVMRADLGIAQLARVHAF